jgi:hypothetical protein
MKKPLAFGEGLLFAKKIYKYLRNILTGEVSCGIMVPSRE